MVILWGWVFLMSEVLLGGCLPETLFRWGRSAPTHSGIGASCEEHASLFREQTLPSFPHFGPPLKLNSDHVVQATSARYEAVELSSGSNVIPRRARPGLAGGGPHSEGCVKDIWFEDSAHVGAIGLAL